MFGYITIYRKELAPPVLEVYQGYYCGLCEELGSRYGAAGRITLSYDMTFTALLLSTLYEPDTAHSRGRCLPHLLRSRPRAANEFLAYAADMSIALAYYNYLDNWEDDASRTSLLAAKKLQPHMTGIQQKWPRQCEAMSRELAVLDQLERSGCHDLDALCRSFGSLLGAVFACRDDEWRGLLEGMGRGLGGFIYLMDAYDDLEKDIKKGRFNALSGLASALPFDQYEAQCHELLTQQMGLCAGNFEMLPILRSTPEGQILYNTLYSGVWCSYAAAKARREKRQKGGRA